MHSAWEEYERAAEWCAEHNFSGSIGDPLPNLLSAEAHNLINADPDAFQARVRATA